jgi:hypothetical protein
MEFEFELVECKVEPEPEPETQYFKLFGNKLEEIQLEEVDESRIYVKERPLQVTDQEELLKRERFATIAVNLGDIKREARAFENKWKDRVLVVENGIVTKEWKS